MADAMVQLVQKVKELFRACFGSFALSRYAFIALFITAKQACDMRVGPALLLQAYAIYYINFGYIKNNSKVQDIEKLKISCVYK